MGTEFIQTEDVEQFHSIIPHKANMEFDNTNVTLSMHSQKKWALILYSGQNLVFLTLTTRTLSLVQTPELDAEVVKALLHSWQWAASFEELHPRAELSAE